MRKALVFLVTGAMVVAGCEATPTPLPSTTSPPTPAATSTPTSTPAPAALPIVVGLGVPSFATGIFYSMSNTTAAGFRPPGARVDLPLQLVYNAIYRYDDTFAPVPDLASEPCSVAGDGLTITCRLVEATFHDGSPLTADDVVFTYELARAYGCGFAFDACVGDKLASVTALDDRTVEFRLKQPDATFLTLVLPDVTINSRAVVEAAYAPMAERAATLDADAYRKSASRIMEAAGADDPDCPRAMEGSDELFKAAALEPLPRGEFVDVDGEPNPCLLARETARLLRVIADSLDATGFDAMALAYPVLSFNRAPIGTGPFRFVRVEDGSRAIFEAYDAYFRGPPATPRIELRRIVGGDNAVEQLLRGELDWMNVPFSAAVVDDLPTLSGLKLARYPDAGFYMLVYNNRKGRLFADPNLRAAMELCIDKPATVDTATDGTGDVIWSPVDPVSWAYQPDLVRPERDVAAARELIESSGWAPGDDGIYIRQGRRLATQVYVSAAEAQRVEFMDLVSAQVRDCGIELEVAPADPQIVLGPILEYPHIAAGQKEPFDALFIGWSHAYDPDDPTWSSRSISSAQQPDAPNLMGFADPRVDELQAQGLATYDQRERARIYRELQDVIAADRPVLFAWALRTVEVLDEHLASTDGELNLGSRYWPWQIEKLVLRGD